MITLEEAIQHCNEVIQHYEGKSCDNSECANEHRQLSEWLKELKKLRFQKQQMIKDAVDGWVARDKDGDIAIFREVPTKDAEIGMWKPCKSAYIFPDKDEYPDVTWDSEPQKVKVIIIKE